MRKLSQREKALMVSLGIGVVALWFGVDSNTASPQSNAYDRGNTTTLGAPPVVRINLKGLEPDPIDPEGRNLFAYHEPKEQRDPDPPELPFFCVAPDVAGEIATISQRPQQQEPDFTYIGFLGRKDEVIAVFDRGTELFLAQIGDVIDERYKLTAFRYDSVVLSYLGENRKDKVLHLTDDRLEPRWNAKDGSG